MAESITKHIKLNLTYIGWLFTDRDGRNMVKGTGILIVSNVITRGLGFLFPVLLTWIFIPSEYGYVRYILTMSRLLGEVLTAGVPNALAQRIAGNNSFRMRVLYAFNAFFSILLLFIIVIPAIYLLISGDNQIRWITLVVIGGLAIDALYFAILRGNLLYNVMAVYRITSNIILLFLTGIVYWLNVATPNVILLIYGYVYLIPIVFISYAMIRKSAYKLSRTYSKLILSKTVLKDLLLFSIPVTISAIAYSVISGIDIFFIEKWFDFSTVGIYGAIKTLTMAFTLVPLAIGALLMPKVASLKDSTKIKRYTQLALVASATSSLILLLAYYLFGGTIMNLVYPAEYQGNLDILYILSLSMALFSIYTVLSQTWVGLGKPQAPATALTISAIFIIAWIYLTIETLGITGVAWGIVFAYLIALTLLGIWTFIKFRSINLDLP